MTAAGTGLTVQHNALVSGVLTTTGNHVANGGMNIGTIRDNTTGAPQATLVTAGITINNPLNAVLKAIGGCDTHTHCDGGVFGVNTSGTTNPHAFAKKSRVGTASTGSVSPWPASC